MQDATDGRDQNEKERAEDLGEQPTPFESRVIEIGAVAELELEQVPSSGRHVLITRRRSLEPGPIRHRGLHVQQTAERLLTSDGTRRNPAARDTCANVEAP